MPIAVTSTDSALGAWTVATWHARPDDELAATIAAAWYFEGTMTHARERVFPGGTHGLIVQLDEPHRAPGGAAYPAVVFDGMRTRSIVVEAPPGRTRVIGLEFTPAGGAAVLGRCLADTIDESVDLNDLVGEAAEMLRERCLAERGGAAEILRCALRWCAGRARLALACDPAVAASVGAIDRACGALAIGELGDRVGRTDRALQRAFLARVGITPKRYARLARYRFAHHLVADGDRPLAEIAMLAGYYDQAHFNAEFREHAGLTPSAYRMRPRYPGSRSIVEPSPADFSKTRGAEYGTIAS